jgi:uncharacterized protein (DUF58 family)
LIASVLPVLVSIRLWPLWVFFWIAMALLHAVDLALLVGVRVRKVELEVPPLLAVGSKHETELLVDVQSRRSFNADLRVDLSEFLESLTTTRVGVTDGRATLPVSLRPLQRGNATVESLWIRYSGPLRLMDRAQRIELGLQTTVVPDTRPVKEAALQFASTRETPSGLKVERFIGDGSEFESLREFQPGHDTRAINWKASARHTKLLVRRFRAERNHQIVLAIDCGRLMAEPIGNLPRLDHAIHAGLLAAYVSLRTGDRVGLYAFDSSPRAYIGPRSGASSLRTLLHAAGQLTYSSEETNFTLGLTDLASRLNRRSLVVVMTDFVDSISAELMVENLNRLAKRHLLIFVALRDPLLDRLFDAAPRTLEILNRAVVSHSLARERDKVLIRLRRAGMLCIDVPPKRMGAELVNRYLLIKRRELIQ